MMTFKSTSFSLLFIGIVLTCLAAQPSLVCSKSSGDVPDSDPIDQPEAVKKSEGKEDEQESPEYAKSSFCGYCKYCKFCSLCSTDCPCTDPKRVGCDMCQYCKYCSACKLCDTFCQAGGLLDKVSDSVASMLSGLDTSKVDKDIASDPKIKEYL